ncbi:hypothetical protein ECE33_18875, partial [Acinetobacter baumannii]|nr:hypothetical protein [Acinetobacter baumannii]
MWLLLEWIPQPLPPERWLAERSAEDFARAAEVYAHLLGRSIKKTTPLRLAAVTVWTAVELLSALRGDGHAELANAISKAPQPAVERVFFNQVRYARAPYGARYTAYPAVETVLESMMERILAGGEVK